MPIDDENLHATEFRIYLQTTTINETDYACEIHPVARSSALFFLL